jgi:hypothetical protein
LLHSNIVKQLGHCAISPMLAARSKSSSVEKLTGERKSRWHLTHRTKDAAIAPM